MNTAPRLRESARHRLGLVALLVLLAGLTAWALALATTDPHGISGSPPIRPENVDRIEPLYGAVWTPAYSLDWSSRGHLIALAGDFYNGVAIVDSWTGRTVRQWPISGMFVNAVRWSPDGRWIATASEEGLHGPMRIHIFSELGGLEASWTAHDTLFAEGLAWSPDGTLLLTSSGGHFALWEAGTWRERYRVANASTAGTSASWSPDGTRLAFGREGVAVYDAAMGALLWNVDGEFSRVAWSPRGDLLAVGTSSASLQLYELDGNLVADIRAASVEYSRAWGTDLSWSPDGSIIALATPEGVALVSVEDRAVLRTLVFPEEKFGPRVGPPGLNFPLTYDRLVAWSPDGRALAVTATTTHPSLRMWAIRASPVALPVSLFGIAFALGIGLIFAPEVRLAALAPDRLPSVLLRSDPSLSVGRQLLLFGVASSSLVALLGYAVGRMYAVQVMPSLVWFALHSPLSLAIAIPGALIAAAAFRLAVWPSADAHSVPGGRLGAFGIVLLPFLLAVGLATALHGLALTSGVPLHALEASHGISLMFALVLGIGFAYAGIVGTGFPAVRKRRIWWGLVASILASAATFFALVLLVFVALNVFRVPLAGEFGTFGIQLLFAFGFVPLAVVVVGIVAVAATGGSIHYALRAFGLGYARFRGREVLELDARRSVLSLVEANPGIHFRHLLELSKLGSGTLHYHLYVLEREDYIVSRRQGVFRRFYVAAGTQSRPEATHAP